MSDDRDKAPDQAPPFVGFTTYADDTPRDPTVRFEDDPFDEEDPFDEDEPGPGIAGRSLAVLPQPGGQGTGRAGRSAGPLLVGLAALIGAGAIALALSPGERTRPLAPEPAPVGPTPQSVAPLSQAPRLDVARAPSMPGLEPASPRREAVPVVAAARKPVAVVHAPPSVQRAPAAAAAVATAAPGTEVSASSQSGQVTPEPTPAPPSQECAATGSFAEKMVCEDAALAAADRRMNNAYAAAVAAGAPEGVLRAEQDDWLGIRDQAARHSRGAVENIYRQRIEELESLSAPRPR